MQKLIDDWVSTTAQPELVEMQTIFGTRACTKNAQFTSEELEILSDLLGKCMNRLETAEQLRLLKTTGAICLKLLGTQFLSHITFDFDILAILVSKHNHYELWKCVARHLGLEVMNNQKLLFELVKYHKKWLAEPEFLRRVNSAQIDSITHFFTSYMTKMDVDLAFSLMCVHNSPDMCEAKRLLEAVLAKTNKKTFIRFFIDVLSVYSAQRLFFDEHERYRYFVELSHNFGSMDTKTLCILISRLGMLAKCNSFLDLFDVYFKEQSVNTQLIIARKYFDTPFTPLHPLTCLMEKIILDEDPVFLFNKTSKYATNKEAIYRLFVKSDYLPIRAYKNVNFHCVLKDEIFFRRLLAIPEISNKIKRTFSSTSQIAIDKRFLFSFMKFIISPVNFNAFTLSAFDDVYFIDGEVPTLFTRQEVPYTFATTSGYLNLIQGVIHPVDALTITRISETMDRDDMIGFVHTHADLLLPKNFQARCLHLFPVICTIPTYHSSYNFRYYTEFIGGFMDPTVLDYTSFYTEMDPATGVPVAVPVLNAHNKYLINVPYPAILTEKNWRHLQKKLMDVMGVSLVDFFYCHNGYLPHFMNSEDAMENVVSDMRMSGSRKYNTPWMAFFFHPFFRHFLPKMGDQPKCVREQAITNVTYGGAGSDVGALDIDFQYHVREMRCPARVFNDSLHLPGLHDSIWLGISIQEVYNQRLIRRAYHDYLEIEVMQVRELTRIAHHEQLSSFFNDKPVDRCLLYPNYPTYKSVMPRENNMDRFTQRVMQSEICLIGSPWKKMYAGREYSMSTPMVVDDVKSGSKRKRERSDSAKNKRGMGRKIEKKECDTLVKKGDAYLNVLFQIEPTLLYKIYKYLVRHQIDHRPRCLMPISHVIPKKWWTGTVQFFRVQSSMSALLQPHPLLQVANPPPCGMTLVQGNVIPNSTKVDEYFRVQSLTEEMMNKNQVF